MLFIESSHVILIDNKIFENSALAVDTSINAGTDLASAGTLGSTVMIQSSTVNITLCDFISNKAKSGAGIYISESSIVSIV